jgi:hypothetical protein
MGFFELYFFGLGCGYGFFFFFFFFFFFSFLHILSDERALFPQAGGVRFMKWCYHSKLSGSQVTHGSSTPSDSNSAIHLVSHESEHSAIIALVEVVSGNWLDILLLGWVAEDMSGLGRDIMFFFFFFFFYIFSLMSVLSSLRQVESVLWNDVIRK